MEPINITFADLAAHIPFEECSRAAVLAGYHDVEHGSLSLDTVGEIVFAACGNLSADLFQEFKGSVWHAQREYERTIRTGQKRPRYLLLNSILQGEVEMKPRLVYTGEMTPVEMISHFGQCRFYDLDLHMGILKAACESAVWRAAGTTRGIV